MRSLAFWKAKRDSFMRLASKSLQGSSPLLKMFPARNTNNNTQKEHLNLKLCASTLEVPGWVTLKFCILYPALLPFTVLYYSRRELSSTGKANGNQRHVDKHDELLHHSSVPSKLSTDGSMRILQPMCLLKGSQCRDPS